MDDDLQEGDLVHARVGYGPGIVGTVLAADLDDEVLIECDQCQPNTAHLVPIQDVRRLA